MMFFVVVEDEQVTEEADNVNIVVEWKGMLAESILV